MLLLVSGATATLRTLPDDAPVGHLLTPRNGNDVRALLATGRHLGADNDCFQRLNPGAYLAMLYELAPYADRVLWVTVPDVVGDARRTLRRWRPLLARCSPALDCVRPTWRRTAASGNRRRGLN